MKYIGFAELFGAINLAFVARAVSNDDKFGYRYMKIEDQDGILTAIATNGRRLHKAVLPPEEAELVSVGYWRVLLSRSLKKRDYETEDELEYDHRLNMRVYEKKRVLWLAQEAVAVPFSEAATNLLSGLGDYTKDGIFKARKYNFNRISTLIKNMPPGLGLNLNYIKDLAPYNWTYKVYTEKAVLFEDGNKTAVIAFLLEEV
jgi:hypothetical protein